MDRERIEREARWVTSYVDGWCPPNVLDVLAERIASLVAREVERAVRDEREACVQIADDLDSRYTSGGMFEQGGNATLHAMAIAAAIRARSAQEGS